jgi:hypothetical protein
MSLIHAELVERLHFGDDAVLLALDSAGVDDVLKAAMQAARQGSAQLDRGATVHQFLIEAGAADLEFSDGTVVWRLNRAFAAEIIELLTEMHDHPGRGHHYVDISAPARMLVLSFNEYPLNLLPPEAMFPPIA